MHFFLQAFRTLEQIESELDVARLQTAALAALIGPATAKMFQFDDASNSFESSSPILLQHLRKYDYSDNDDDDDDDDDDDSVVVVVMVAAVAVVVTVAQLKFTLA
ncbi:unnamed protein product [Enterobius vermicularis]|uniref:Uncharacterized protein n=1 Tax=Enterobius vermicularis TaxID=51028 RepID=A0A0N4VQM5_ENTVE|nr:unnamed protein product [Enterobius vermicularis]